MVKGVLLFLLCSARAAELKIFLLAGQSNMEGQAEVATLNKTAGGHTYLNGTLMYQLTDPRTATYFASLWDKQTNNWTIWPTAAVWYNEKGPQSGVNGSAIPSNASEACFGKLTVGYGSSCDPNLIGPELGFGVGIAGALGSEKFLIMKTAWGGKTLAGDFRPPSSTRGPDVFCQGTCDPTLVGHYYSVMVADAHKMLAEGAVAAMFPDLAGLTPRVAGFGWFQGWNDGCDLNQTAAYETNMVNLIKDIRTEFNDPALPVSIAAAGFNGFNGAEATRTPKSEVPWIDMPPYQKVHTDCTIDHGCRRLDIVLSQLAAGNATRHPDLGGHVRTMETRAFWRDARWSPNPAQGYHYWHNAETYYLVGRAMADGMVAAMLK